MRSVARVLVAVMVVSGLMVSGLPTVSAASDDSEVAVTLRATACLDLNLPVQATIRLKMKNQTDEPQHLFVEIANRATSASPPFWKYAPYYTFQDLELDVHETAFVNWKVGPETLGDLGTYRYWVVKVWKDAPYVAGNLLLAEGYLYIPACGSPFPPE
jgi:hypothetical protein